MTSTRPTSARPGGRSAATAAGGRRGKRQAGVTQAPTKSHLLTARALKADDPVPVGSDDRSDPATIGRQQPSAKSRAATTIEGGGQVRTWPTAQLVGRDSSNDNKNNNNRCYIEPTGDSNNTGEGRQQSRAFRCAALDLYQGASDRLLVPSEWPASCRLEPRRHLLITSSRAVRHLNRRWWPCGRWS